MHEFTLIRRERGQDRAAKRWALARKLVLGVSLALACQSAWAQAMYRLTPVGNLPGGCASSVSGLNKADKVTGQGCNANGDSHAFLWNNDGTPTVDLGPPEVGSESRAYDLNASGLVTGGATDSTGSFAFVSSGNGTPMTRIIDTLGGNSSSALAINALGQVTGDAYLAGNVMYHAFVWKNNGSPMLDLGTLGGDSSDGAAINASGEVAGGSDISGNAAHHAFVWKNNGSPMLDLGTLGGSTSNALFINASGQVAGVSVVGGPTGGQHGFLWRNDGRPIQDLGTLGGPFVSVYGLNDKGQVAGSSYTHNPGAINAHAFVWLNDGTPMKDLGALGGFRSSAHDINSSGQVTGFADLAGDKTFHAFLWRNDGTKIQDLNTLIDPTDPLKPYVTLTVGDYINDLGDIVADGFDSRTRLAGPYLLHGTVLTLSPRLLAFGNQPIHTTSAAKSVTVTNTSSKPAAITSIKLAGSNANQFTTTNNCGGSLAGKATCTINVKFSPTTKGAKSANLSVNGGGGGLRTVTLTGTGT